MTTEDRRNLIKRLEAKQLVLDAQGGRNVELADEIDSLHKSLYPFGEDDEDTCCSCGVTFIEMSDFDNYQSIKTTGRCEACERKEMTKLMSENTNCLKGMKCPDCGSLGPFRIVVSAWALMTDEGSEEVTDIGWENNAPCICKACGYEAGTARFRGHKFYRTEFRVSVLSEEPLDGQMALEDIAYAINEGPCVGRLEDDWEVPVSPAKMAEYLIEYGSDPSFFDIDEKGNPLEEDDDEPTS